MASEFVTEYSDSVLDGARINSLPMAGGVSTLDNHIHNTSCRESDAVAASPDAVKIKEPLICQPCRDYESEFLPAEGFCVTCGENLCAVCFQHHTLPRPMRDHVLQGKDEMPRKNSMETTDTPWKPRHMCPIHDNEEITSFCNNHNMLCCKNCVSLAHELCLDVNSIEAKSENIEVVGEFQSFLKSLNDLLVGYKQTRSVAVQNMKEIDWYYDQALMTFKQTIAGKRVQDLGKISKAADVCDKVINQLNDTIDNIEQSRERRNTTELFFRLISMKNHTVLIGENLRRINQDNSFERYFFQPKSTTLCFGQTLSVSTYTSIILHDDADCNQLLLCPGNNLICISQTKISCINTLTKMKNGINILKSPCLAQYVGNELIVIQTEPPSKPSLGNLRWTDDTDVELQVNNITTDSFKDEIAVPATAVGTKTVSLTPSTEGLFGAACTTPSTGGLFGTPNTTPNTGGLFGAPSTTPSTGGLFGTPSTTPSFGGLFGTPSTTPNTGGLFGAPSTTPNTGGLFGAPSTTPSTEGLFGTPSTTPSTGGLFGTPSTTPSTGDVFGAPSTTPINRGLFGTPITTPSVFGASSTTSINGGMFGAPNTTPSKWGLFGTPSTTPNNGGLFGTAASTSSSGDMSQTASVKLIGQAITTTSTATHERNLLAVRKEIADVSNKIAAVRKEKLTNAKPILFPVQAITSLKLKYVSVEKILTALTYNGTDLIAVCLDPLGIYELDAKGHTKRSTVVSNLEALLFNGTQFIKHPTCAVYDLTEDIIYVTDSKMDSVFKVTKLGECRCVVRSERLASPSGIALCRDGTLMVCCSKVKCVVKVTKDGHIYSFIGPLQFEPLALAYDETKGLLYIGGKCSEIYVYNA
ncbi:uncharacterized protein LOC127831711 [Dreissena polymorpha]|uniref:B box-type domain-containing protein n=1 Tax=Dreissena polymorpha TaxID=45954 RepID=A0A9D4JMW7_DREPO|nr:uncharacterized protein LOC127831711 [Dreissena polymorpha]XP_052212703.1 uncharacterized protein LOC127831711 [Dreissena polymorpha]XP_052212704.1 uncharacterized protein LOC127831711 [Dreissena polymorpha]KAH3818000.1 hypothetical protein DPMN_119585 [Dreissena polymorpha]